jgi:hypothetical protein
MKNGSFRNRKVYFAQVSDAALRDPNISLRAKGLYSLIESFLTIPDFTLYKSTLKRACKEGRQAFDNAWDELKKAGYLKQHKIRDAKTGHFVFQYELLDVKEPENAGKNEIHHTLGTRGVVDPPHGKAGEHIYIYSKDKYPNNKQRVLQRVNGNGTAVDGVCEEGSSGKTGQREAKSKPFSPELEKFVDETYPHLYGQITGYEHPPINSYQRVRVLLELNSYLSNSGRFVGDLEDAAEEFLSSTDHGDGSICLFASSPEIIENRLARMVTA